MTDDQNVYLTLMFTLGLAFAVLVQIGWDHASRRNRAYRVAWVLLWLAPPLWFIWTKGVMG